MPHQPSCIAHIGACFIIPHLVTSLILAQFKMQSIKVIQYLVLFLQRELVYLYNLSGPFYSPRPSLFFINLGHRKGILQDKEVRIGESLRFHCGHNLLSKCYFWLVNAHSWGKHSLSSPQHFSHGLPYSPWQKNEKKCEKLAQEGEISLKNQLK